MGHQLRVAALERRAGQKRDNLTGVHESYILMHMRTTLNIDDTLLEEAARLTGVKEKTALVKLGLQSLVARESSKRLAALGGSEKRLRPIPRRRATGKSG